MPEKIEPKLDELLAENIQLHERIMLLQDQVDKLGRLFQEQSAQMVEMNRKLLHYERAERVKLFRWGS